MVLALEAKARRWPIERRCRQVAERSKKTRICGRRRTRPIRARAVAADELLAESDHYLAEAVEAGKAAFVGESAAKGDARSLEAGPTDRPDGPRFGWAIRSRPVKSGAARPSASPRPSRRRNAKSPPPTSPSTIW